VAIRDKYTYIATNDHGAWRSNGKDTSKWLRISSNPGMPRDSNGEVFRGLSFPMIVSDDEKYIYLVAKTGYMHKGVGYFPHYAKDIYRLMLSTDQGNSWKDATKQAGLESHSADERQPLIRQILFDPSDSQNQWILLENSILLSKNGGQTFDKIELPADMLIRSARKPLAFDSLHKTMYMLAFQKGDKTPKVMRSLDMGRTWKALPFPDGISFYCLATLENGDLALSDDGRLMVIPYDKISSGKIDQSMIRLTVGKTPGEAAYGMRTFKPIVCRGMNILTFPENGWNHSISNRSPGPLLSRDGGKTFQWIVYDFRRGSGIDADIRNGKVIIGTSGTHILNMKDIN
jgi:hypothetical protein